MVLTKSNKLGEDIYKKEVFYIDPKAADSLYSEIVEFRSSLSRELQSKFVSDLDSLLETENGNNGKKSKKRNKNNSGLGKLVNNNQKLRKPVITFFTDKARVLREEIVKINKDMKVREEIYKQFFDFIQQDVKETKRLLHELSLYSPGTKHSIDIRRLDLEREIIGLRKELRISKLSLWKDLVFLRRELREIIFEYQALKRMGELVENGGKNDVSG